MRIVMRILIVRTHPTKINIKTYNVQELGLAKALIDLGHECDVLLYTDEKSSVELLPIENNKEIKIYWMHGKNAFWQGIYDWNELFALASKYDWIQVNEYNQIASYLITQKYPRNSYIYHGPYYNPKDKKYNLLNAAFDVLFLRKMRKADTMIFAKSEMATQTLKAKGFSNVITTGVGLDIERFGKISVSRNEKDEKTYKLLYIGELSERRNTLFLIDVFKRVYEKMGGNVSLQIIGKGKEAYASKVKEYAKNLNVEEGISFIARKDQSELPEVYGEADLFVFPTNYDIFGMVLLEALYFGVPVISSKNGGSETLLKNVQCGKVIERFDVDEWTSAIVETLENRQLRSQMSQNGHKEILESFTWKAIASKMISDLVD